MRITDIQRKKVISLRDRVNESGVQSLKRSDFKTAVVHVHWLFEMGERYSARGWWSQYKKYFWEKLGLPFPELGADLRSLSSGQNGKKGGRPSLRPSYCSRLEKKGCRLCSLATEGFDCSGQKIGRTWGGV